MRKFLWSFVEIIETAGIAIVAVVLLRSFVVQPFLVSGSSMEPNFQDGDYLLIDELTYRFRRPIRGEVVVFKYPENPSSYFIKRIVGLPGEKVVIENGQIAVSGGQENPFVLIEDYLPAGVSRQSSRFEKDLAAGEYFVMGDNRNSSFDSRNWGALPIEDIVGVTRLRLWPVSQVMAFEAPAYSAISR